MDIEYLLWLQNLREASCNVFTPFMMWVSNFSVGEMLLIPVFVYWCISKRGGMFLMLSLAVSNFLNDIIKMTFCVYRPFMRDARVSPMGHKPSGYSFPSGHTMTAAPICLGLAILSRKKSRLFSRLCVVMVLLVMFSRNYLGVPQRTHYDCRACMCWDCGIVAEKICVVIVLVRGNGSAGHVIAELLGRSHSSGCCCGTDCGRGCTLCCVSDDVPP